MAVEQQLNQSTRVDHVGRTGIFPVSGPLPPGNAPLRGQGQLAHPEERTLLSRLAAWSSRKKPSAGGASLALGRALFGGYFLYNGIQHFRNRAMYESYARSKGVPLPSAAVLGSGALILLGGLSLLSGARPQLGASLIGLFLTGVSPKMHDFWSVADEQQRMQEFINFTKNVALVGGACLAAAVPQPWPWSVPAGRQAALAESRH